MRFDCVDETLCRVPNDTALRQQTRIEIRAAPSGTTHCYADNSKRHTVAYLGCLSLCLAPGYKYM